MCDCLVIGKVMIMDTVLFIEGKRVTNIPKKLAKQLSLGEIKSWEDKSGNVVINGYKYKNEKFKFNLIEFIKKGVFGKC